jgi:hypothetical protein
VFGSAREGRRSCRWFQVFSLLLIGPARVQDRKRSQPGVWKDAVAVAGPSE